MSDSLEHHARVLGERWPVLLERLLAEDSDALQADLVEGLGSTLSIAGIQLTSRHDRTREAHTQAASLPEAPVLHLYGCGLGDLQRALLQRPELTRLYVHILNGAVFRLVLQLLDQQDWLADPRVELLYAGDLPEIQLPFFALPAELVLADDYNAKIRDRLISETHLSFNNRLFSADAPDIAARLAAIEPWVRADRDVAELFDLHAGREVFVIATGPSLEQHYQALRAVAEQPERPLLICVDTAYLPLLKQGIRVDLVVSIDQRISTVHLPGQGSDGVVLVYMPLADPLVLEGWRGPRYVGYSSSPVFQALRQRIPRAQLHAGGSVIHPAVDLAVKMGGRRITLFGADFAFPQNRTHAGWQDGDLGPQAGVARHWVLDGHGQRVKTQLNFRSYLCELERYIASRPEVVFFNTSRSGAMILGATFHGDFVQ
ncbi:MAG: motility associated factor glycosyltransferase family protein [Burkholderiales bacterium]